MVGAYIQIGAPTMHLYRAMVVFGSFLVMAAGVLFIGLGSSL
jgi:hypothetical protein